MAEAECSAHMSRGSTGRRVAQTAVPLVDPRTPPCLFGGDSDCVYRESPGMSDAESGRFRAAGQTAGTFAPEALANG
ncbi:MAG: hypothetical protein AMXMBFR80_10990 [Dehalococcoidia bacterium]